MHPNIDDFKTSISLGCSEGSGKESEGRKIFSKLFWKSLKISRNFLKSLKMSFTFTRTFLYVYCNLGTQTKLLPGALEIPQNVAQHWPADFWQKDPASVGQHFVESQLLSIVAWSARAVFSEVVEMSRWRRQKFLENSGYFL